MTEKHLTLVVIYNDTHILLGMKKRGFGEGRWNGFGGKVQEGETVINASRREVQEEAGVIVPELRERGTLRFTFEGENYMFVVHLYSTNHWEGEPQESEEMRPQWFTHDAVPYADMWPDDIFWLPLFLQGKNIQGTFHFQDQNTLLNQDIQVQ